MPEARVEVDRIVQISNAQREAVDLSKQRVHNRTLGQCRLTMQSRALEAPARRGTDTRVAVRKPVASTICA
jgi:hypothetical protein